MSAAAESGAKASAEAAAALPGVKKKTVPISYEKYRRISLMLVHHLRSSDDVEENGMQQKALVDWYLEQADSLDEFQSEAELNRERKIVSNIIHRLVEKDQVLITLSQPAPAEDGTVDMDARVLSVHPNFTVDSEFRA
eukprot:GFYU01024483.1.p1 GENE.GFYU01024483.1~~GFYU01024483.1.p1  ORF type:complete len:146 (-),score=64.08 GFYU01024483.1:257-670(-)